MDNSTVIAGVPNLDILPTEAEDQRIKLEISTFSNAPQALQAAVGYQEPSETPDTISFHDTQGTIEVNGSGQLQFTLPIALPPAIKSVAPQVNLIYSSGSGNGIAGYGWALSGVTGISRMGRNMDRDGEIRTIQFDYTDYYMFSGQRLILKSGEYGKDGAEYVTEKYSNTKIRSIGENPERNGPAHFEVTFEDGSQALYGSSAEARTPIEYNIVHWQDAQGNYISYGYVQGDNVASIYRIEWGGNARAGTPHFNSVIFDYAQRELRETSYVNGTLFAQHNLLSGIYVHANNALFKTYKMAYEKDDKGNRYQFLKSITETNAAGESANPVVFDYAKSNPGRWTRTSITNDKNQKLLYGDFDGDGKLDVIKYADAFKGCLRYENIYRPGDVTDNDNSQTGYWESYCAEPIDYPAGIYHFGSVFDDDKPQRINVGSLISRAQLERAKVFNLKNAQGEILSRQGFFIHDRVSSTNSPIPGRRDLVIKGYSLEGDSETNARQLKEEFVRTIPADRFDLTRPRNYQNTSQITHWVNTIILDVRELDIDGDGVSELIFVLRDYMYWEERPPAIGGGQQQPQYKEEVAHRYLLVRPSESDPEKLTSFINLYSNSEYFFSGTALQGDFNGDGCVDFIDFDSGGRAFLTKFEKNALGHYYADRSQFSAVPIDGLRHRAIVGDFTGDGKTDLLVPQAIDSEQWKLYISTGTGFRVQVLEGFQLYKESFDFKGDTHSRNISRQYFAQDLNKDGKADFLAFYSHMLFRFKQEETTTKFMILYHENKGIDAQGNVIFEKRNIDGSQLRGRRRYKMDWYPDEYDVYWTDVQPYASHFQRSEKPTLAHFSPLIGDFRINNFNENILVFREGSLVKYAHYSVADETYITAITQGGIVTQVKYDELDPQVNPGFYDAVKKEQYPYVEMDRLSRTFVVSQLRQENKKQDFKYRGFVAHVLGKGMLGFRKSARSSWYTDPLVDTKIWSGSEMDPLNDGLPIKEWTVRTRDDNALIFPTDLSPDNAQLLSFRAISYAHSQPSPGVTAIVPVKTIAKDFLTDVLEERTITYGDYYLPASTTTVINNGYATTTTVLAYAHNIAGTGRDYFVGRPSSKVETVQAYADTKQQKEEYTYDDHLLTAKKTYNRDGSGWVQETYEHDTFGNIVSKTISNSVDAMTQTETTAYEPMGRFVVKKTDNLGLETQISYNDLGQVLTQNDPSGMMQTNVYDGWGKMLSSQTNLGGTTTYVYQKMTDKGTRVTEQLPDGTTKTVFTNKLGQQVKSRQRGFNSAGYVVISGDLHLSTDPEQNNLLSTLTVYDDLGRKVMESEPHRDKSPDKWNTISYDDSVFPTVVTALAFTGKQMRSRQEGRTSIAEESNGYLRINKQTADPLGNVLSSEDAGGVINFSFNAAGDQISAQYVDNTVRTAYDAWGRRSLFADPANGEYSFAYNGFGQITKEISPKGYKEYRYNEKGQLIEQIEKSTEEGITDKTINYRYDAKGLLLEQSGTANGEPFRTLFTYDSYGRLLENREESFGRVYMQRDIQYDDKSRIVSYVKSLQSEGVETVARIQHSYDPWSGLLFTISDADTGRELWRIDESNPNGQILRSQFGETRIRNTYNEQNMLTETLQESNQGRILGQQYVFDPVRNELNSRVRSGNIALTESFAYDNNNRLVEWTNPVTGSQSTNTYDIQGRIIALDTIGTVRFDNAGQQYRPSRVNLNATGKQHYTNDLIQEVVYNENSDPRQILGTQATIAFDYGLGSTRQRVVVNDKAPTGSLEGQPNASSGGGFTKYYSADGSCEVIRNNATGEEKHILFIGGSPYESSIVYLKDYAERGGSYKFLHKDYLGSILAISDENGHLVEERHFDAWGNLTHGTMALLDRGYTSHEHFDKVGIIHMNGRLYDPTLRRFLNADAHIQEMFNTQNYNKYGYVLNNPLMNTDPSGQFFLAFISFVAILKGIVIGAVVGIATYSLTALITKTPWRLSGALGAMLQGAITGAITSGFNVDIFSTTIGTLKYLGQQTLSAVMPSYSLNIGNFDFSISASIAFGKGWGFGANLSVTFRAGEFSISGGYGIMNYGSHAGSGQSGWEYRYSKMFSYDSKSFGFKLGTNSWRGLHPQQAGILGFGFGKFSLTYENDGSPFAKGIGTGVLADNNDSYRTAAMTFRLGDSFQFGFNLFTGERSRESYADKEMGADRATMDLYAGNQKGFFRRLISSIPTGLVKNGVNYPFGLVEESEPRYRLGAAYVGWNNYRIGIDSDRYVRYPIQVLGAHYYISQQPGQEVLSNAVKPYFQYQSRNKFTSW
ncbi:polymorphic toxin type 23 domain-containing protein [Sphingobacterium paludis]|uniref:RHS repeat-associated protein n=1 Tax=Sphingobacterium paludis TaxID=1476465 RepID=A0A4R7D8R0_9SPHI|nr:polymorphic toxin type 23 domain-containing protein [Sphingobacterium paludis]TDS17649.1 RHS repeat-associated protein [Sphingobacterium paludis]